MANDANVHRNSSDLRDPRKYAVKNEKFDKMRNAESYESSRNIRKHPVRVDEKRIKMRESRKSRRFYLFYSREMQPKTYKFVRQRFAHGNGSSMRDLIRYAVQTWRSTGKRFVAAAAHDVCWRSKTHATRTGGTKYAGSKVR